MAGIPKYILPRERATFAWHQFKVMIARENCVRRFLGLELWATPQWVPQGRRLASSSTQVREVVCLCCFFRSASSCFAIWPIQRFVFVHLERGPIVLGVCWKAVPRYNFSYSLLLPGPFPFSKSFSNISHLRYFPCREEGTLDQE